jgi:hypothetical protein
MCQSIDQIVSFYTIYYLNFTAFAVRVMEQLHIGSKIREVLDKSHFSVVEFADRINKSRTVVYDIFERESLDSKLLFTISKVLNCDFFSFYYTDEKDGVSEPMVHHFNKNEAIMRLSEELSRCKERSELLEKILKLREEEDK